MVLHMQNWGTLQLVLNYLLYSHGFVELPPRYNFVLMTAKSKYRIREGRFYDGAGELIPLVHNAGGSDKLRFVRDFGYGPGCNRPRRIMPLLLATLFFGIECWRWMPFIHGKAAPCRATPGHAAESAAGRPHAPVAAPHLPVVDSPVASDHTTSMPL